jgi:hypothetical protein
MEMMLVIYNKCWKQASLVSKHFCLLLLLQKL